jgi:phosphohistidine phosphatase
MRVILVRHGAAEADSTEKTDALRELTPKGRRQMKRAARGTVNWLESAALIATSPLIRAVQTADIIGRAFARENIDVPMIELTELSPRKNPMALLAWLGRQDAETTIILVGHEPTLSRCAGLFVCGKAAPALKLGKGAACEIEFATKVAAAKGRVKALFQGKQLRAMA